MSTGKILQFSLTPSERARFEQQQQKFLLRLQTAAVQGQRCIMLCELDGTVLAYADKTGNVKLIDPFCQISPEQSTHKIRVHSAYNAGFYATHEHIYYIAQTGHIYQIHSPDPNQLLIRIHELPPDAEAFDVGELDLTNSENCLLFTLADTVDAIHSND